MSALRGMAFVVIMLLVAISFRPFREATITQLEEIDCGNLQECVERVLEVDFSLAQKEARPIEITFEDRTGNFLGFKTPFGGGIGSQAFRANINLGNIRKTDRMTCMYSIQDVRKVESVNGLHDIHFYADDGIIFLFDRDDVFLPIRSWRGYAGRVYDSYSFQDVNVVNEEIELDFRTIVDKGDTDAFYRCFLAGNVFQINFYPEFKLVTL